MVSDSGMIYDGHAEYVHVSVIDNGDGTLSRTIVFDDSNIVFDNHVMPGLLTLKKSASNVSDDVFTFEVMFD